MSFDILRQKEVGSVVEEIELTEMMAEQDGPVIHPFIPDWGGVKHKVSHADSTLWNHSAQLLWA